MPILRRHGVKRASIFASFDKSLFDLIDLKSELEETFGRKIDIVTYDSINWRLLEQIRAEQVKIL